MSFGSFKSRIAQAAAKVEETAETAASEAVSDVAAQATQGLSGALDTSLSGWADKVGDAAALLGTGSSLSKQLPGGKDTMPEAPVKVSVQIGGKEVDPKKAFVERIQTRHAVNEIPSATVVLSIPQAAADDYAELDHLISTCKVGEPAVVKVDQLKVFDGVVGAVQVTASEGGRRVKVRLKHKLQLLKATQRSRVWKAQQDAALVRAVLGEHQVRASTVSLSEGEAVQRFQWNCSDWQLVRALLGQHGAWLWPLADGSVKIQPPQAGGARHRIAATPGLGGVTVLDAEWDYSGLNQPKTVSLQSWDLSKQTVAKKTAKAKSLGQGGLAPGEVKALGCQGQALVTGQWDGTIQQAAADGWLAAQHAQAVKVRLTVAGCKAYQVGDTLALEGFGSHLNGQGLVTQVEYQCDVSGRVGKTVVGVGLDEEAATAPSLPMPSGLVIGQVAKFQADPKGKWNRLPVKIPVLGEEVVWARMGHVYASKESGVTFYPEAGDEVALGFVGWDPVIMASLHNPKLTAAIEPSAKNAKKGVVLRHEGQRVELSFDRDKHTATFELGGDKKPEQHLLVDKEKGVTVLGEKGDIKLELKAGGVAWTTKKKIEFKAEEQVTVAAKTGVSVSSDKDVSVEAKAKLVGKGKASVQFASEEGKLDLTPEKASLSANQTSVTGEMTVKLQGNESLNVKGAKVGITGEAEVAIEGAKVAVKGQAEASVEAAEVKVAGQMTDVGGAGITNVKGSLVNLG
ncbi:contractile injection system protein, VgrG/Pvc8 family [Pseudomonas aeruginosa]|uniref:contractile injection system protein, VgrG/Pvc8 family n=1 Tax=Pseudomonas aeruginosa TaxID=287 RepID=UPI002ADD7F2C|nr:contractile injection system protein, VgrG/Pvc8 family [Pseudomonas aeruginosa]MEA0988986.1 contractile injection system protein, VgrG/Pvc8 family [Pseudomonas aeruginosa]